MSTTQLPDEELRRRLKGASLELIAARVRRARRTADLSHDAITQRMEAIDGERTFRQTLIGWERQDHRPSLELLTKYAEATNRHVEWFLDPDLDPSPFQEAA